jgi:trehalose 6-phosphate phosphatase
MKHSARRGESFLSMLFHHTEFRARKASGFLNDASQVAVTGIEKCQARKAARTSATTSGGGSQLTIDRPPPEALNALPEIRRQIGGRSCGFFLDLDGTLAPIASRPEQLWLPPETRTLLDHMARLFLVCVVSGRGLKDLQRKVGLGSVYYAAAHGHRIVGPAGSGIDLEVGGEYREDLDAAAEDLRSSLYPVTGVVVEAKGLSVSVHYRLVAEAERADVDRAVAVVASRYPGLRLTGGKLVHELGPPGDWDKGRAMLWLLEQLGRGPGETIPICVGDDLTDENMFVAAAGWGVSILVGCPGRPTMADYRLADYGEVAVFLRAFAVGGEDEHAYESGGPG